MLAIHILRHAVICLQTSSFPLEVTMHPTMTSSNTIEIAAKGTTPLKYQWFSGKKKLTDGARFEGTETSKLVIKYTSSPSEGCYKCTVQDKHEKSTSSNEIGKPVLCVHFNFKVRRYGDCLHNLMYYAVL